MYGGKVPGNFLHVAKDRGDCWGSKLVFSEVCAMTIVDFALNTTLYNLHTLSSPRKILHCAK